MSDPYVTKGELGEILLKLEDRLNSARRTKIIWIDTPITLALTWDTAWHTYDFTSETSENAKGVILGVYLYRADGNFRGYLYTAKYNNLAWEGIVDTGLYGTDGYLIGGMITQGIDNQQRMNYCGQAATRTVKLVGYWE